VNLLSVLCLMVDKNSLLIVTDLAWFDDYSQQKYHCIHLTVTHANISEVDLFMLAASRLYHKGEFLIKLSTPLGYNNLTSMATKFNFERINTHQTLSNQLVFRFSGRETKIGFQMAQSKNYSDCCLSLFKDAFGSTISDKFWHWKYPKDKAINSVVALKGNKAIAHYGLCDRRAVYNNASYGFSQAADVMVAPNERGAITSSVFYELVQLGEKPFYASDSNISVIYGFPHGRHYRLGARLKLYEPVSPIFEVVFDIPACTEFNEDVNDIVDAERVDLNIDTKSDIESVLKLMFSAPDVLFLDRSYVYLLQRYVFHPEYEYKIYRFENCYFVIKVAGDRIFLMDYIGSIDDYAEKLDGFIVFLSQQGFAGKLQLWCLKDFSALFINPNHVNDTGAVFVCKKYTSDLPDFKQWWVTMGDTEFL
jgi:hypothetical protein